MGDLPEAGLYLKTAGQKTFYAHHWSINNPKACLLLVHGFAEHTHRFEHVYSKLNSAGIACLGIDLFGHGRTEGLKGHVDNFDLFLDQLDSALLHLKEKYTDVPIVLYGHSMGANITLNYIFKRSPAIAGAISTGTWIDLAKPAPALKVWVGKMLRNILPKMTQETELNAHLLSTDTTVGDAYIADPLVQTKMSNAMGIDILEAATYLRNYSGKFTFPMLLMHGGEDQITSPTGTVALSKRLEGDLTLKIWEGMYHEIHNEKEKEKVIEFTINWIEENIFRAK